MLHQVHAKRRIPSIRRDETLLLCYPLAVCRFLNCSLEHVEELEQAGSLKPSRFWHELQIAIADDPDRERAAQANLPSFYSLVDVIRLMPNSEVRQRLRDLYGSARHIKAAIVQPGFVPYLDIWITRSNRMKRKGA
jgi:hypothetical protein